MTIEKKGGFTIVEAAIAAALTVVIIGGAFLLYIRLSRAYATATSLAVLQDDARRGMEILSYERRGAAAATLSPPLPGSAPGAATVPFQTVTGYVNEAPVYGAPVTYAFVYEPGESDDGLDNNGNGLVDEGRVVRTVTPGIGPPVQQVIVPWVREGGFGLWKSGNTVTVSLTLERKDPEGRTIAVPTTTTVRLRN